MILSLDRFSNPLAGEFQRLISEPYIHEAEKEIYCSCGCGKRIWLEDVETYLESEIWEDQWIIKDIRHIERYYRQQKNDLLLGSKPHN